MIHFLTPVPQIENATGKVSSIELNRYGNSCFRSEKSSKTTVGEKHQNSLAFTGTQPARFQVDATESGDLNVYQNEKELILSCYNYKKQLTDDSEISRCYVGSTEAAEWQFSEEPKTPVGAVIAGAGVIGGVGLLAAKQEESGAGGLGGAFVGGSGGSGEGVGGAATGEASGAATGAASGDAGADASGSAYGDAGNYAELKNNVNVKSEPNQQTPLIMPSGTGADKMSTSSYDEEEIKGKKCCGFLFPIWCLFSVYKI